MSRAAAARAKRAPVGTSGRLDDRAPGGGRRPQSGPDLRVVRRRRRGLIQRSASRKVTPVVIGGVILVALLIATVLLEQVLMAQSAFKLGEIRRRMDEAETRQQELVLQVTQLENNERIESFARTELGMVETNATTSEYMVAEIDMAPSTRIARGREPEGLDLVGTAAAYVTGQEQAP